MNDESNNNSNVNYDVDPSMIFGENPINGINPDTVVPNDSSSIPKENVENSITQNNNIQNVGTVEQTPSSPVAQNAGVVEQAPSSPVVQNAGVVEQAPSSPVVQNAGVVEQTPSSPVAQDDALVNNPNMIQDETTVYFPPEEKKSKAPIIIIAVVLLLVLAVGGYFAYTMFFANPFKRIPKALINDLKNSAIIFDKPYKISGNMSFESKDSQLSILNDLSINYEMTSNLDKSKALFSTNILEKENKIIGFDSFIDNNKAYIKSGELFDKVLLTEVTNSKDNDRILDTEETLYVIEKVMNSYIDALTGEKLHKESVNLTLNGSTFKATNNYYLINSSNYSKIMNKFKNSIKQDEKLLKIIAKYTGGTVDELKEELKESTSESSFEKDENIKISIYTKGILNDFVGAAYSTKDSDKEYKLIDFVTDNTYISLTSDLEFVKMSFEGKKDNITFKMTTIDGNQTQEVMTGNIVTLSKDSYAIELNIMKQYTFKFKAKIEENVTISPFDINDAVNIDDLTEEDTKKIDENLEKALQKSETYSKIMQSIEDSYSQYNNGLEG